MDKKFKMIFGISVAIFFLGNLLSFFAEHHVSLKLGIMIFVLCLILVITVFQIVRKKSK